MNKIKLAFYGSRGSGKTTIARRLLEILPKDQVEVVCSAKPIYSVQRAVYQAANLSITDGTQDEKILAGAAKLVRMLNPSALFEHVKRRLVVSTADIFLCPDSTIADRQYFAAEGFSFVYVWASLEVRTERLIGRGDIRHESKIITPEVQKYSIDDIEIENNGTIRDLDRIIRRLLYEVL